MTTLPEDVHSLIWRHYFSNGVLPDLPAPAEPSIHEPSSFYIPLNFYFSCPLLALSMGLPLSAQVCVTVKQPPPHEETEAARRIEKDNARHLLCTQRVQTRNMRQRMKCHAKHQQRHHFTWKSSVVWCDLCLRRPFPLLRPCFRRIGSKRL